jgi:hypothetical protein
VVIVLVGRVAGRITPQSRRSRTWWSRTRSHCVPPRPYDWRACPMICVLLWCRPHGPPQVLYLLFESASGLALFEVLQNEEIGAQTERVIEVQQLEQNTTQRAVT